MEQSIKDYTGEAFDSYDKDDVKDLLKDRLQQGRERLEETREAVKALCERVESATRYCGVSALLLYR